MKYDIYFHDDFDGRASAAVLLNFLRSRGDDIKHYVPVNFDIQDQWLKEGFFRKHKLFRGFRNPAIVVDFLYHPDAAWWFDHHETSFKRNDWRKKFRPSKYHQWNPRYASCCHQVLDALKKTFRWRPPKHLRGLAKWLDVVDGAQYKSAKQVIEMKEPALQVSEFVDRDAAKGKLVWLIKLLSRESLADIAKMPRARGVVRKMRGEIKDAMDYCRKRMKIFGRIAALDMSRVKFKEPLRFMMFYLRPDILYAVRIGKEKHSGVLRISFGVNPWRRVENKIDIGKFLNKNFGGGGHKAVGGAEFKSKKELDRAVKRIIQQFK